MRPEHLLVVDDEKRIVENIRLCLEREGFLTSGAHDAESAIELFRHHRFDLVLMDVNMPGISGYDAMEHFFGIDKDIGIIIITGYASVESAIRALKLGAWDYLKKPFEYADLIKTVKNALAQRKLISEKQAVCARLEASERRFEYMVNNSPDLIFTLDDQGRFVFVNHQFKKVLGFSEKELIGTRFDRIVHEDDLHQAADLMAFDRSLRRINDGQDIHLRFKKACKRTSAGDPYGSFAFMELKASPMHLPASDTKDEFNGVYAVARDVTERINLEEQLRQAQKMEAIGTLAGGIAHDFNNILMGIQGYASLVKAGFKKDSPEYKRLSSIDEYVFSGAEMAKQLLGFVQKTCQETALLNLNYLLKMSAKMFGRTKKDISIEQYLEKNLWTTKVDEGQIKQVLLNLFVNAWQAMPDGGKIIIASENVVLDEFGPEKAGAYVKITVSDTGVGISKDIINRVFDPFFTTKTRGQGTGLGLATAYGIIKSHKGFFKVKSKQGHGSSFMFFLPAVPSGSESGREPEVKKKIFNGRGTVLLVDDEKGVIEVCSEMLKTLGYEVKTALSGREALGIVASEKDKIDLVILDMVMPKMAGREIFEQIRQIDPEMKVLVSSGYSREEDIRKMLGDGCNDYIRKPFDVATLSEKLKSVFGSLEKA